jgi:hypothetical protein
MTDQARGSSARGLFDDTMNPIAIRFFMDNEIENAPAIFTQKPPRN